MKKILAELGLFVAIIMFIVYCYELLAEDFDIFAIILVCISWYSLIYYFIRYNEKR